MNHCFCILVLICCVGHCLNHSACALVREHQGPLVYIYNTEALADVNVI